MGALAVSAAAIGFSATGASPAAAQGADPVAVTHGCLSNIVVSENVAIQIPPQLTHNSLFTPLTASGCTGAPPGLGQFGVCIRVTGYGTYVSNVVTSAYASYSGCSSAQLIRNGAVKKQAPIVCYGNPNTYCFGYGCGQAGTMLCATFSFYSNSWFHVGDKLCVRYVGEDRTTPFQWNGGSSTPMSCETIG